MRFLIRSVFWLGLLFLFVPLDVGEQGPAEGPVGPVQALFAARDAVRDLGGFCERQPDVCATARTAIATITARVKESIRIAQELADQPEPETEAVHPVPDAEVPATGSISSAQ